MHVIPQLERAASLPALVFIHRGGWSEASKEGGGTPLVAFVRRRYAVAVPQARHCTMRCALPLAKCLRFYNATFMKPLPIGLAHGLSFSEDNGHRTSGVWRDCRRTPRCSPKSLHRDHGSEVAASFFEIVQHAVHSVRLERDGAGDGG